VGHDVELRAPGLDEFERAVAGLLFVLGSESDPSLPAAVERAAGRTPGLGVLATLNDYVGDMSDHHVFRGHHQPFLFLSCGQGRHYHTVEDTPEWLNFEKVARVAAFVEDLVRGVDGRTAPARPADTTRFEIRMLERALRQPRDAIARLAGLSRLESREDLTAVVQVLSAVLSVWAQ
jgi:hypothetical protein